MQIVNIFSAMFHLNHITWIDSHPMSTMIRLGSSMVGPHAAPIKPLYLARTSGRVAREEVRSSLDGELIMVLESTSVTGPPSTFDSKFAWNATCTIDFTCPKALAFCTKGS